MVTYFTSDDCLVAAANYDEIEFLQQIINSCLATNGIEPWARINVEAFELDSRYLIFARPASPVSKRLEGVFPRLLRR